MKLIKLYEEFWGKKDNSNEDLEFDFLAAVGKLQKAIKKIVEVHEKHYYNDVKISTNEDFNSDIKSLTDKVLGGDNNVIPEDYLVVVHRYENQLYNENKMNIATGEEEEVIDESMFGIFDELINAFRMASIEKTERSVSFLEKESQHILDSCDDSWVYQEDMETSMKKASDDLDSMDFSDLDDDYDDIFSRWDKPEDFQKDLEQYIGKKLEDFEYGDKLSAYNWVEKNKTIQSILSEGSEEDKSQVSNFLNHIKEFFGL